MNIHKDKKQENMSCNKLEKKTANKHQSIVSKQVVSSNVSLEHQTGAELISAERERQIKEEGWTEEHDDQHKDAELAWAACYYAMPCPRVVRGIIIPPYAMFPENWDELYAKRRGYHDRVRDLVKAGALIAAEIDRLRRES